MTPLSTLSGSGRPDGKIYGKAVLFDDAVGYGYVSLFCGVGLHLFGEIVLSVRIFRHDQKTGGIHVQSVDESDWNRLTGVRHILHQPVCDGVDRMTFGRDGR